MGEERRSVRSLPDITSPPDPSGSSFLHRNEPHPYGESGSRPRSTYDLPFGRSTSPKPMQRSLPNPSHFNEPGPSSAGSRFRPPRSEYAQNAMNQVGPPPLAPYVTAERRYYAPKPSSQQWLGPDGRRPEPQDRPIFPPPPKPPPPHIVASTSSSSSSSTAHHNRPDLPSFQPRSYSHSPESSVIQHQSLHLDRPTTTTHSTRYPTIFRPPEAFTSAADRSSSYYSHQVPQNSPSSSSSLHNRPHQHGEPLSRTHSHESQHSHHSYSMQREHSGGSSISGSSHTGTSSLQSGQPYPMGGYKKKRTRALMTHMQQSGLTRLWRKTKFPTGADREKLGQEIGLTPRQVQVWFQNQRQKGRKAIMVNGGIPEGEDPADYEDLQKSPRSRRLSVDGDDRERISAWAGSSNSSASTRLLLDPPSSAGSNYHEPMIHQPRPFASSYHDDLPPPRSAISLRSPSPYEQWEHEQRDRGVGEDKGKQADHDRSHHSHHHHRRSHSHSYSHSHSHSQSDPNSHSHHPTGLPRYPTYPSTSSSSSRSYQHQHHHRHHYHHPPTSGDASGRLPPISPNWDINSRDTQRPFPSVLEPISQSSYLPAILSPLSTSSSSRPDTQQTQTQGEGQGWTPLPIKRRRSSPSLIPESIIKPTYPGNIEPSQTHQENIRFSRSRSHSGEDHPHPHAQLGGEDEQPINSRSHLPPELARIAITGPLERIYPAQEEEREGEERGLDLVLPRISKSLSPIGAGAGHIDQTGKDRGYVRGRSEEPAEKEMSELEEEEGDGDDSAREKESRRPISSNLRNLLD
ncbi:hypothetical protein V866_004015 [Kwoniella sp. B9012]